MEETILSISKAAKYLGVMSLTLRNWEKRGLIKSFRTLGGHRRFKKSELDRIKGIENKGDKLAESIKKLEEIKLKDGSQQSIGKIIKDLKKLSDKL